MDTQKQVLDIDTNSLRIEDVIDVRVLQKFQDNFALCMGMGTGTIDTQGNLVTNPSYFTDFCMKLTHSTYSGKSRCDECSKRGGKEATRTGRPYVYQCHAGLIDFAVPIMVEGKQIGSIIGGQILSSEPDESQFRKTAREIEVSEEEYVEAVSKVNIVSEARISAAAEVLFTVANSISQKGYEQLKLKKMLNALLGNFNEISLNIEKLNDTSAHVTNNHNILDKEIVKVKDLSNGVNKIFKEIERIADETTLLGFNATIEAKRTGTAGTGFGVIATEVRSLAQKTKDTAEEISSLTEEIQSSIDKTISFSNSTLENVRDQFASIKKVKDSLQVLTEVADSLSDYIQKERALA